MFKRIYIELSNYCNLSCVFCTPKDKFNRMLTFKQFEHIFNEIKPYTNEVCLHVLGEPTIHPDFFKIVNLINSSKLNIMLSTNGKDLDKLYNKLMNVTIKTFNISLHSTYYLNFDEQNEYLVKLYQFINAYQKNHDSVFYLRLWADSNEMIHNSNENIKKELFKLYNYNDVVLKRIRLKEKVILSYENEFEWPSLLNKEYSDGYCLGGKSHVGILANGEVVICCLDSKGDSHLGNIFNTSFKDILNSETYLKTIESFKKNKCYLELCKHCSYKRRN